VSGTAQAAGVPECCPHQKPKFPDEPQSGGPAAFDTSGPDEPPTPAQLELVEKLCHEIVRRRLALPALVFLEMSRPLNTLSAQALHFLAPMLSMFSGPRVADVSLPSPPADAPIQMPPAAHELLAQFLERRDSVGFLCDRIEALEKERASEW
jgi:hypothetical protein